MDEALLFNELQPVLRFYSWERETVSLGYFCALADVRSHHGADVAIVRRWTGGGTVLHGDGDATYALTLPVGCPMGRWRAPELYGRVHGALADALRACGVETEPFVARDEGLQRGSACFQHPVPADLLLGRRKIAGAAIRRCGHGILLQGSIQGIPIPRALPPLFARQLALQVDDWDPCGGLDARVAELVARRYGLDEWTGRR